MGLHEGYVHVRGDILRRIPLPDIDQTFYMVKQEEKVRQGYVPSQSVVVANVMHHQSSDNIVAVTYSQRNSTYRPSAFKKGIICNYCNKEGHTRSDCYRPNGFPVGHPAYRGKNGRENYGAQRSSQGHYGGPPKAALQVM